MKKSHWQIFSRLAIAAVLYPWLVSFDGPGDTLSHTISIYGSEGSYTHVTRDCSGNLTSILPVPFAEVAASYEVPIQNGLGFKLRGGYLHSLYGYNLMDPNQPQEDSSIQDIYYGGASLLFNEPFWGASIGGVVYNKETWLSDLGPNKPYAFSADFRLGYLSAWYLTMSLLNSDPLIGSRPYFNTGIGFALNNVERNAPVRTAPSNLWIGLGLGPPYEYTGTGSLFFTPSYDPVICAELTVPAWTYWRVGLRGGGDPSGHGGGYMSGALSYGW
jgi:hypothetical protein